MNEVVGHSEFVPYPRSTPVECVMENALRQIIKARQVAHAKSIAKEALEACGKNPHQKPRK